MSPLSLCTRTVLFWIPVSFFLCSARIQAQSPEELRMIVPGFTVRELPVDLTSLNNIEYDSEGRLFAGGYDGRFHMLIDRDGDGLEETVSTLDDNRSPNYPLGVAVKNGVPYFVLTDEVIRFVDKDGDHIPETRETVAKGFDDPTLSNLPYLHRRRVDSSMGLAIGPDDSIYVTMGNAGFSNPYWHDGVKAGGKIIDQPEGDPQYSPSKRRGCLLRIRKDGQVEQLASGLRYVMSLQFDSDGELFATDQEGATWSPNGNPFDELLHLSAGRHYGFPPSHPKYLPNVIDEPSVWDYAPQHQSTCGFRFNGPSEGRGQFGPSFWQGDAIVTGESRGKLWRTSIAKTNAGYVAGNQLIGTSSLLVVDVAISPKGDLVVCCHTGAPDWGNGPNGKGKIFKITQTDPKAPRPVTVEPLSETLTRVSFDNPLTHALWEQASTYTRLDGGHYVAAADRYEAIRPGYAVVNMQQKQFHKSYPLKKVAVAEDRKSILIESEPRREAWSYGIVLPESLDVASDLSGVFVTWNGKDSQQWKGWLPHADWSAARKLTRSSATHDSFWKLISEPGLVTIDGQLDLWKMLIPATQPRANLGYEPAPETVTLRFSSDAKLSVQCSLGSTQQLSDTEVSVTVDGPKENQWTRLGIQLSTPATRLDVSYSTDRDPTPRALATRRFLVPFALPAPPIQDSRAIPEIAGGSYDAGRELFKGKAACATCHQFRGEGFRVGADLGNSVHRDYASLLRDIIDPNATINPDAVAYTALLTDGRAINGIRVAENADELHLAIAGGKVEIIKQSEVEEVKPMTKSLMPPDIQKNLTPEELRDLMTYLLTEPPKPPAK